MRERLIRLAMKVADLVGTIVGLVCIGGLWVYWLIFERRRGAALWRMLVLCVAMVDACLAGEVSVAWTFSSTNVDGTPLTDLAGAKVYWGDKSSNYTHVVDVPGGVPGGPGRATVTVPGLTVLWPSGYLVSTGALQAVVSVETAPRLQARTYYLNGTAYNTAGLESDFCREVAKAPAVPAVTSGWWWARSPETHAEQTWIEPTPGSENTLRLERHMYAQAIWIRAGLRGVAIVEAMPDAIGIWLGPPARLNVFRVSE